MESPKTYRGYDEKGETISTCTAQDANQVINPQEVATAVQNVYQAFTEGLSNIASALHNITTDADKAIVVDGTSMAGSIDETASLIMGLGPSLTEGLDSLVENAVEAHDMIQQEFNNQAQKACWVKGVVAVR